jgi:hypothetical protein
VTRSSVTVATASPLRVGQRPLLADGVELDDGPQRCVPVRGAAQRDQRGGRLAVAAQRAADLVAAVGPGGQLEVPPRVVRPRRGGAA